MLAVTLILARVIAENGATMPRVEDGDVLLVKRQDVVIGEGCSGMDAGVGDGGVDAPDASDAGPEDAGVDDGGVPDAGADAGCETIPGDAVTLVVQPRFSQLTTGARFALLMVTPARPIVEIHQHGVFAELDTVTRPQVIVHETEVEDPSLGKQCGGGCGFAASTYEEPPSYTPPGLGDGGLGDLDGGYTVDTIGPYEVLRAQPVDTAELETWLRGLGYLTLPADVAAIAPYIERGYTVVALRVKIDGLSEGSLMPISLTWPGTELRLPVALGSPAGSGPRETTVYIAADERYELPGAAVPFAYPTSFGREGFLTKNVVVLDDDSDNPDDDPVAIGGGPHITRETEEKYVVKRVPVRDCGDIGCGCGDCSASRPPPGDWVIGAPIVAFVLMRKRRRGALRTGS